MRPDTLADVAILFALPLTREEFGTRVRSSDWLRKYYDAELSDAELEQSIEERWQVDYLPFVAEPLRELVAVAKDGGVEVYMRATLETLASASHRKHVVVLFAHWKGPEVEPSDLVAATDAIRDRVRGSRGKLARWLDGRLNAGSGRDDLVQALNEAVDLRWTEVVDALVLQHAVTRKAERRDDLNTLFRGLLAPGNRLELWDGLHSKEEVEGGIAADFDGVMDLTVCTSTALADHIAARRSHRIRTVQFPEVVDYLWAAKCMRGTLRLLSSGSFDYQEARDLVTRIMNGEVTEASRKRGRRWLISKLF